MCNPVFLPSTECDRIHLNFLEVLLTVKSDCNKIGLVEAGQFLTVRAHLSLPQP